MAKVITIDDLKNINKVLTDEEKKFILGKNPNMDFHKIEVMANGNVGKIEQISLNKFFERINNSLADFPEQTDGESEMVTDTKVSDGQKQASAPKFKNGDKVHCAIYTDKETNENTVFIVIGEPTFEKGEYVYYVTGDGQHYVKESLMTVAETAEKIDYPTEVYEKAEIESKTTPNGNVQRICDVFTLEQLQKLFGGSLSKDGNTLNLRNIRVKGYFVTPKIAMDSITEDYSVTCYSKPTEKNVPYKYDDVNKSVINKVTSLMWQFAKGEISPIRLGETWVDVVNSDGEVGEMLAEDVADKKKKPYKVGNKDEEKDSGNVFVEKYKPSKKDIDICTVEDSVAKFNPNMTDNEIRGYVFYKKCLGVPMVGWEKWFLKRDDENGVNLGDFVYAGVNETKPISDYPYSFFAGQFIGLLVRRTKNFVFALDNYMNVVAFDSNEVEVRENKEKFDRKEFESLIGNGLFVRDVKAPKSNLNRNIFIPERIQRNDNNYCEILQVKTNGSDRDFRTLFLNYEGDGIFKDTQTGQVTVKLENIFDCKKDSEGKIQTCEMPRDEENLLNMFYDVSADGKKRAKKGFGRKKDSAVSIFDDGILAQCESLVSSYDSKKQGNVSINSYIRGFYGKDKNLYLIPYNAIETTHIFFTDFTHSFFVPKSELLRGNLRALLKTYTENEEVTEERYKEMMKPLDEQNDFYVGKVTKSEVNDEVNKYEIETEKKKSEGEGGLALVKLPNMEQKYNNEYGGSLGTLQKNIIENEIDNYITTYDFKASNDSGYRPYIAFDSDYSELKIVSKVDGQPVGDIINAYSNNRRDWEDGALFSLKEAFYNWFLYLYDEYELKLGVTKQEIKDQLLSQMDDENKKMGGKASYEVSDAITKAFKTSNVNAEIDRVFSDFIANNIDDECVKTLNEMYNERESCISPNLYNYAPIGFSANKSVFSKSTFELNKAQVSGLRFLAYNGSGLLMHDVGFGKTLTAIHNLASKLSSGEITKPIVCVPKMVYANWAKEMFGCWRNANNQIVFKPFAKAVFESGVLSGTDVNILLLGNGSIKGDKEDENMSSLFSQNYSLYDSNWKFLRKMTVEQINSGFVPAKTIILCTHEAVGNNKISFKDLNLFYNLRDNLCRNVLVGLDGGKGFSEKLNAGGEKSVGIDSMGADYFVMDEYHNAKALLKQVGRLSGVSKRSTLAKRTFLITTYFSVFYRNNVNLLSATPFTNAVMEIISALIMTNLNKWFFEVPQNSIGKFSKSFVQLTYEVKIKHSLEISSDWTVGKFKNRKVLKDIVYGFINYNFDSKTAGICRPTKINYPSRVVDTSIGETELARRIRKIIMKILHYGEDLLSGGEKLASLFVKRYPIYSRVVAKKMLADGAKLPPVSDNVDELVEAKYQDKKIFSEDFLDWLKKFKKLGGIGIDKVKDWATMGVTSINELILSRDDEQTLTASWLVFDFVNDKDDDEGQSLKKRMKQSKDEYYDLKPKTNVDKTFTVLSLLQSLSICPYFVTPNMNGYSLIFEPFLKEISEINSVKNVSLDNFMSNCGKIDYVANCIKSIKEYHEKNAETIIENTKKQLIVELSETNMTPQEKKSYIETRLSNIPSMSGQVVYIGRGIKPFDEIQNSDEWDEETKNLYMDNNILDLTKKYIMEKCGFVNKVQIGRKSYDEVEIISGDTSDIDRKNIQDLFQSGKIHVIIGTSSIREGINLQKRSTALYVCSIDWNPTDFQQLEGRIWRQGDEYQFVRVVTPIVQNTLDSFIYQKMSEKINRIESIFDKSEANVVDVSFTVSLDELKFQVMDDVNELVKMHKSETIMKLKTLIVPNFSLFKLLEGHYEGEGYGMNYFEGILKSRTQSETFRKCLVGYYGEYKKFLETALDKVETYMREETSKIVDECVKQFNEEYDDREIVGTPITNLEDRTKYKPAKDSDGKFVKDENGKIKSEAEVYEGIFSQKQYKELIENWKKYIADIDNFIKKSEIGNLTKNDIPTNAMFNDNNLSRSPRLDVFITYNKISFDKDGSQSTREENTTMHTNLSIDAERIAYKPRFDGIEIGERYYWRIEDVLNAFYGMISDVSRISRKLGIDSKTTTEELYKRRNDLLIKLVGDGEKYLDLIDNFESEMRMRYSALPKEKIEELVQSKQKEFVNSLFGNNKNIKLFNNAVKAFHASISSKENGGSTDVYGESYDDDAQIEQNYLNGLHGRSIENSEMYLTEYMEYVMDKKDLQLLAEMTAELAKRNRNLGNAREVAMYFAKYNYIISEKFGRKKHGVLPNYIYNDDSVLGVQPTRKIYLPNDDSEGAVEFKLLKIRDFIPFAQYNSIIQNVQDNAETIDKIYLNVYSVFATKESGKRCIRYYNPKKNRGFYVLSRGMNIEDKKSDFIMNEYLEDLTDENFTTQSYQTLPFVISGDKDLVVSDEIGEQEDFSRETEYILDVNYKTEADFYGKTFYTLENEYNADKRMAEEDEKNKMNEDLNKLLESLNKIEKNDLEPTNISKMNLTNVEETIGTVANNLDSETYELLDKFNEKEGQFLTNVLVKAVYMLAFDNENLEKILQIIHKLNLLAGVDDTEDIEAVKFEYARIKREETEREKEETRLVEEFKNAEGIIKETKDNTEKTDETSDADKLRLIKIKLKLKVIARRRQQAKASGGN